MKQHGINIRFLAKPDKDTTTDVIDTIKNITGESSPVTINKAVRLYLRDEQKLKMSIARKGKNNGVDNHKSILTIDQVIEIKKRLKSGDRICDISRDLKIEKHNIKNIKYNNTWRHINI